MAPGATPARTELAVPLRAGPAHRLVLTTTSKARWSAIRARSPISISARDRFGNPVSAAEVVVRVDGRPTPAAVTPSGRGDVLGGSACQL